MNVDKNVLIFGGIGAMTGIGVPVAMERFFSSFWGSQELVPGQSWSQRKIVFPLGIGVGAMAVGYAVRNKSESASAFAFVFGAVLTLKATFDLISTFLTPSARVQRGAFQQPVIRAPLRPMIPLPPGAQENIKFRKNGERDNGTTRTWIDKKVIWA
jgi:hypothetical protein